MKGFRRVPWLDPCPEPGLMDAHMRIGLLLALLSFFALMPLAAAEAECAVRVTTRDGSRLDGMVTVPAELALRPADGAVSSVPWHAVRMLRLAERVDPKLDAEARAAVKDLHDDRFEVRSKGLERLKALGWAAAPALREAQSSSDAEVAAKSRQLLAEMNLKGGGAAADLLVGADGVEAQVAVVLESMELRTRHGVLRLPAATLDTIERLDAARAAELAQTVANVQGQTLEALPPLPEPASSKAQRFDFGEDENILAGVPRHAAALQGLRMAGIDKGPDPKTEVKAGTPVEDLYAAWGLLLCSDFTGPNSGKVVADDGEAVPGATRGLSATLEREGVRGKGGLEARFVLPGSFDAVRRAGRPGGVHVFGCMIGKAGEGRIGLEAFDARDRLLLRIFNRQEGTIAAGGVEQAEFMGVRSTVPIVRVRLFRTNADGDDALRVDDIGFSRVAAADRDERFTAVTTRSGERFIGHLLPPPQGENGALSLRPVFLPPTAPAWSVRFDELAQCEPARPDALSETVPPDGAVPPRRVHAGQAHAVLLQNGEHFRAHLVKLDKDRAVFALSGGAELVLPRALLRKVDLYPEPVPPGETSAALKVAEGEKIGVEFKQKLIGGNEAAPQRDAEKKDPNHPAAGLPRMDNAEILQVNYETNELVVDPKDGGGAWPIDLNTARFLVFPHEANAAAGGPQRAWTLILRQGSRFNASLLAMNDRELVAEFAGGKVTLPLGLIETLMRKPAKP